MEVPARALVAAVLRGTFLMAFSFQHPGRVSFFPPLLSLPPLVKFSGYQSRSFTGSRDLQTLVNQVLVEKEKKASPHTHPHM